MSTRRLTFCAAMLAIGVALLATASLAAARPDSRAGAPRKGGTLRLATGIDPVDFVDPALAYLVGAWQIEFATCAKLFNTPDEAGVEGARTVQEVVSRYRVSPDGRTYVFDLRRTFRFHTGARVTAASFATALNRVANRTMRSPGANYMHEIVGADAVLQGKANTVSGVRVLAPYRLQIRLTRPVGDLTARLTTPFFCPLPPGTPVVRDGIDNPPGSGPYYIAERVPNKRVVLKRNRYYRGDRPAYVDDVVWTVTGDLSAIQLVEENKSDFVSAPPFVTDETVRGLSAKYGINRPGGRFYVISNLATWFLVFNHRRSAFGGAGQIPLKRAVNFAIDRPELARVFGYLGGRRTAVLLPPAFDRGQAAYPLGGADPATARKWLARAKVQPERIVLYAGNNNRGVAIAQVLAYNFKQIGIDLDVRYYELGALLERVLRPGEPWDLMVNGWGADYGDPAAFLVPLVEGYGNLGAFADAGVSARIAAVNRLDGEARSRAWAQLDADVMRTNPPWAPFLNDAQRMVTSRSLGCFFPHPIYGLDIATVCKK